MQFKVGKCSCKALEGGYLSALRKLTELQKPHCTSYGPVLSIPDFSRTFITKACKL